MDKMRNVNKKELNIYEGCCCFLYDKDMGYLIGVRRDNNKYCIPGGKLENKEDSLDGIVRETKEEFGIELNKGYLSYLGNFIYGEDEELIYKVNVYSYKLRQEEINIKLQEEEYLSYTWMTLDEIKNRDDIWIYTKIALKFESMLKLIERD